MVSDKDRTKVNEFVKVSEHTTFKRDRNGYGWKKKCMMIMNVRDWVEQCEAGLFLQLALWRPDSLTLKHLFA